MDDIPVGQKSDTNQMFNEELPPETVTDKSPDSDLPLPERLISKVWAVRATAFTELATQFNEAPADCANDTFKDQSGKFPTYIANDNNPASLEKCLDAFSAFINKTTKGLVSADQSAVLMTLIEKCLVHAKPIIKQKSLDIALQMFEISENFEQGSLDAIEEMCKSKKLPVQIASTGLLAQLLQGFGVKRFPIAQFQQHIEAMANHSNPAARTEAQNCYKALYLWLGDKVEMFISNLKPQLVTQLKEEFPKHKEKFTDFKRSLRSEKGKVKSSSTEQVAQKEEEIKQEDGVDMYDLVKGKEILTKFGSEWREQVAALKVWSDKKAKLELLANEIDTVKLAQGDYTDLVELLKKLVGDSHSNVQQFAVKCLGLLAKGLRDGFTQTAKDLFPLLISKLKDKKLVDEIQQAFTNLLWSVSLGQIVEQLLAGLKDKLPMIQRQTLIFVERSLHVTYKHVILEISGELQPQLVSLTDSFDTETKEQSFKTLGVLCGRMGTIDKLNLPAAKKAKIEEAANTVKPSKYDTLPVVPGQANKPALTKPKREVDKKMPAQVAGDDMESPLKSPEQQAQIKPGKAPAATKFNDPEDQPLKQMKPNAFNEADEQPIKPMKNSSFNDADEMPIKSMKPNAFNEADELPIKSMKPNAFDEADEQPPVGFSSKPAPKRKVAETDTENGDQPKPPVKKPPALSSNKPAAAKKPDAKPTGKTAPSAGDEDEDSGGMTKEDAIEKVGEFFSLKIVMQFDQEKWQDKVQGFKDLQEAIIQQKPESVMIEAICRFMKVKMKDWKESNMNMIKETINTLKTIVENCDRVPKRALFVCSAFLIDKIGDSKYAAIKEVFMQMADFVTAKFVGQQIIKHATATKAINNIKESCNILTQLLDEWGGAMMPIKDCIDFATLACGNSNVQVRNAAMALFAMLYKHLGETVRPFLTEIKESTMKVIEDEFKKITPLKKGEFKSSRALKGDAVEEVKDGGGSLEDSLPREDITKQLTAKLLAGFKNKEWKTRKETSDAVVEILKAAKMRIEPNGLQDLMEALKAGMKESNKAVIKAYIQLLGLLADAIGPPIKQWTKKCLVPMIFNLSDKQSLVRQDVIDSMNKWAEAIGPEMIVTQTCIQLETENPELRDEGLKWIQAHKNGIKKAEHSLMVKPLVDCLTDKVSKIRTMAEEIVVEVMSQIGFEAFIKKAKDLKIAVQQAVMPILDKAKSKAATPTNVVMEETKEPEQVKRPQTAQPASGPTLKQPPEPTQKQPLGPTLKHPPGPTLKQKEELPSNDFNKSITKAAQERPMTSRAGPTRLLVTSNDEDTTLIVSAGNKERRAQIDAKAKWLHEDMKPEQTDKVKNLSEQLYGQEFMQKMFSVDFKKHNEVLKAFSELRKSQPQSMKDTLDIIIKWSCIKLAESSNTSFALAVFEFYQTVTEFLAQESYQLSDIEASILVPMLCEKSGLNNAVIKEKVKNVIKQVFLIYDNKKYVQLIFKYGVQNKNLRAVSEMIEELTLYIKDHGLDNVTEKDLQILARLADAADKGVRESALSFIGEVYKVLDEEVWRLLGPINIKVKGLLEGRFKQVKKGTVGLMNSSINAASPLERKSLLVQKPTSAQDQMNQSLNKSIKTSTVNAQTPRRVPPTVKNTSSLSLSKSIKKENPISSSLNVANPPVQPVSALKFQTSSIERQQQPAQAQQTLPTFVQENKNIFQDDDDDLIQLKSEIESQQQQYKEMDPKLKDQVSQIMKYIQSLKYGDLSKRVDALVAINDIIGCIQKWNQALIKCANELCGAMTHVLIDVFEKPLPEIPLRFAKYFTGILNRVCSSPDIMLVASERESFELIEQLLVRLLTEQLDKLGENKEGEVILKTLNAAMLRLLENCQPTFVYLALYNLLKKYKNFTILPKMPGLVIKCLLKLAKIIEKQASGLQFDKILLVIHEYLLVINHDEKSQNDEMGIRITKTVINEMVKIKGEQIWDSYGLVERHAKADNHISRWISVILQQPNRSLNDTAPSFGSIQQQETTTNTNGQPKRNDSEIKKIIEELRSTDLFEGGIKKLHAYLQRNPQEDLASHLSELSSHFSNFIRTHLEQYQNSLVETGATPEPQQSPTRNSMVGERRMSPFAQQRMQNSQNTSSNQQSRLMQPKPQTFNSSGSTGRAPSQLDNQQQSSDQRISSYQEKLSQMRDKLHKSGSQSNILLETGAPVNEPNATKPPPVFGLKAQSERQQLAGSASKDKNTSFSNMNSSLSTRWKQISAPKQSDVIQPSVQNSENTTQELNQLRQQNAMGGQQATQTDLQTRLAEMKAKLQKINQKKE